MTLVLIVLLVTVSLFAVFWGGGLIAQSYFYNEPAEHLPYRAAGAAFLVAVFLAVWCALHRRNPEVYNTFFEFAPYTTVEFTGFDAVRWTAAGGRGDLEKDASGKPAETVVPFKKQAGGATGSRLKAYATPGAQPGSTDTFALSGSKDGRAFMTGAVLVKANGADAPPVRFDAELQKKTGGPPTYTPEWRFTEAGGSRYLFGTDQQFGTIFVPSAGAVVLVLFLNLMHFAVWLAALWLVMRFSFGHALLLTVAFGVAAMLVVMPLLFKLARRDLPPPAPQVVWAGPPAAAGL